MEPASWSLAYRYVANVDPVSGKPTGLPAGWIAVTVRGSGEVVAHFSPAPIPGAAQAASFSLTIPRERAEGLRARLAASSYERLPSVTVIDQGQGEPVMVGVGPGDGTPPLRALYQARLPRDLRPFLDEMTRLYRELQAHPLS